MKKLMPVLRLVIGLTLALYAFDLYAAPGEINIELDADLRIDAGDPWQISISIAEAQAGDTVAVRLINGLQIFQEMLTLGTGGVGLWRIPAEQITQAGESLIIVSYNDQEIRQPLRVSPNETTTVDLFTTANAIPAYGEGVATIMILPRDAWGNAAPDYEQFTSTNRLTDGDSVERAFRYSSGLGWYDFISEGGPGRVRLSAGKGDASLEILQTPGEPAHLDLQISPTCVLDDGRDIITITAHVTDAHEALVADGTLITFTWEDGFGYGRTIDGQATLRMPAPISIAEHTYTATSGNAQSNNVSLLVTESGCVNE